MWASALGNGWGEKSEDAWISNTDATHQSRYNACGVKNICATWPKHVGLEVSEALGLKDEDGLLANTSAALQNAHISEAGCEFNLELVLFQMPAQSM